MKLIYIYNGKILDNNNTLYNALLQLDQNVDNIIEIISNENNLLNTNMRFSNYDLYNIKNKFLDVIFGMVILSNSIRYFNKYDLQKFLNDITTQIFLKYHEIKNCDYIVFPLNSDGIDSGYMFQEISNNINHSLLTVPVKDTPATISFLLLQDIDDMATLKLVATCNEHTRNTTYYDMKQGKYLNFFGD